MSTSEQPIQEDQAILIHGKGNVYVYHSIDGKQRQKGFLIIFKKNEKKYIAWVPNDMIPSEDLDTYVRVDTCEEMMDISIVHSHIFTSDSDKEKMHCVTRKGLCTELEMIRMLLVYPPSFTQSFGKIILSLRDEMNWPELIFEMSDTNTSHWGGQDVLDWLNHLGNIVRSPHHEHIYVFNPTAEDCLALELDPIMDEDECMGKTSIDETDNSSGMHSTEGNEQTTSVLSHQGLGDVKWKFLENLAQVTHFSRRKIVNILDHRLYPKVASILPSYLKHWVHTDPVQEVCSEYTPAAIYLAKWASDAIKYNSEFSGRKIEDNDRLCEQMEMTVRREVKTELGVFEMLGEYSDIPRFVTRRQDPVTAKMWFGWQDEHGRFTVDIGVIKQAIFSGGVCPEIRKDVWPFLLGVFPWDSSKEERVGMMEEKRQAYETLKQIWQTPETCATDEYAEQVHRIEKDVLRTDRTVPEYVEKRSSRKRNDVPSFNSKSFVEANPSLVALRSILLTYSYYPEGHDYVQGMSDLLSPIYAVLHDESLSFWCFVGFMKRMKRNFSVNQLGMHEQLTTLEQLIKITYPDFHKHLDRTDSLNLFFCFRWILIWFKREFSFEDIMRLWEVLWTDYYTEDFHLFIALAILDQQQLAIRDHLKRFDEILKYVNDLSMCIELDKTLCIAERLFLKFRYAVKVIDEQQHLICAQTTQDHENHTVETTEDAQEDTTTLPVMHHFDITPALRAILHK